MAAKMYLRRYFRDPRHLDEFVAFLFPHYATSAIPDFHRDLYEAFSTSLFYNENVARAAPRGSAKSTVVGVVLLAWIGIYRLRRFVIYISNTSTQAEGLLSALQQEFETNERLIWLYGDLRSKYWNKHDFVTTTGVRFVAKGQGVRIRGLRHNENRPDLLLFDDLENDDEVINPLQRDKLKKWFLSAAMSGIDPEGGIAWYVGTILHPDSLLNNIINHQPPFEDWNVGLYRAIQDDGTSFWPSRFPMRWLEQKRLELGTFVFNQEYQNEPIVDGTRLCPPSYIRPIDTSVELPMEGRITFMAVDPAISKAETADKTAIVGGYVWRTPQGEVKKIRITYAIAKRMTLVETATELKSLDGLLKPRQIAVESVAYQQGLVEVCQKFGLPAKAIKADGDKVRRFNRVSPYFEQGLIEIDPKLSDLIRQLLNFTGADGAEDDLVDACVYFLTLCTEKPSEQFRVYVG